MARVTVEDCIQIINNRYELVLLAAQRARDIAAGAQMTVDRDNDKNPVVALREIAGQTVSLDDLRYNIARGVNRHSDMNLEDDVLQTMVDEGMPALDDAETAAGALDEIQELDFVDENAASASETEEAEDEDDSSSIEVSAEEAEVQASSAA